MSDGPSVEERVGVLEQRVDAGERQMATIVRRQQTVWQTLIAYGRRLSKLDGLDHPEVEP
jgi:hypothetical protein